MGHRLEATETASGVPPFSRPAIASLPPKGTCWYCDNGVDNVRRFCSPTCRNDYLEEEAGYFNIGPKPPPSEPA